MLTDSTVEGDLFVEEGEDVLLEEVGLVRGRESKDPPVRREGEDRLETVVLEEGREGSDPPVRRGSEEPGVEEDRDEESEEEGDRREDRREN